MGPPTGCMDGAMPGAVCRAAPLTTGMQDVDSEPFKS